MYMHTYGRFCWSVMLRAGWWRLQRLSVCRHITTQQSSTFSVVIFKKRQGVPPLASNHHHHHHLRIGLLFLKSLVSFPCLFVFLRLIG